MALKLKDNEALALKSLKDALLQKYDVLDFRVFGSKIKGLDRPDSDIDVMIELREYNSSIASEIDDIIFEINLAHDAFISTVIFGKKEIEEGPLSESPIYKVCKRESVSMTDRAKQKALSLYRLTQAEESLDEARYLLAGGKSLRSVTGFINDFLFVR